MSDRVIKLLLVDQDPIFRTGLRVVVEQFSDLQVAAEAESFADALQILADLSVKTSASTTSIRALAIDLVVLEVVLDTQSNQRSGLKFCRRLKTQYPNLPLLLLTTLQEPTKIAAMRQAGVNGYCPKGIPASELVAAMRQVAAGQSYWVNADARGEANGVFTELRNRLHLSGLRQIDETLDQVKAELKVPGLALLDQAILAGQQRELLAARWLVNQLLGQSDVKRARTEVTSYSLKLPSSSNTLASPEIGQENSSQLLIQSTLFELTLAKLQSNLENLTRVPLEIDIFREEKKRELLNLVLKKIDNVLNELRSSQVGLGQLPGMQLVIIQDVWQAVTTDFYGKYSTVRLGERNLEIVNLLLQDAPIVRTAILVKIPLVADLFSCLLFQAPLVIDNASYPVDSVEAIKRAELILDNLVIQIANGVVQPLLNRLADVEAIKQSFYDQRLISTRKIERFRNDLSWEYRLKNYISEPKAVFESRYELFILASRGIAKISIYAPRSQELTQFSGIQLAVTLALETRDAIAPRLRAAVAFLGRGVVYFLTQVIGRAIGLVGRGILQGIGGSLNK